LDHYCIARAALLVPAGARGAEPVDINTLRVLIRDFRALIDEAHSLTADFRERPPTMIDLRQ